jgi:hypothetical protein
MGAGPCHCSWLRNGVLGSGVIPVGSLFNESSAVRRNRPPKQITMKRSLPSCFRPSWRWPGAHAFGQDSMTKDAMHKDAKKKDAMHKGAMKPDTMAKDAIAPDAMKK